MARPSSGAGWAPATPLLDTLKTMLAPLFREDLKMVGEALEAKEWLRGMRPAARAWDEHDAEKLETLGVRHGKAAPMCFAGEASHTWAHCDDFVVAAPEGGVERVRNKMREWYDARVVLGQWAPTTRRLSASAGQCDGAVPTWRQVAACQGCCAAGAAQAHTLRWHALTTLYVSFSLVAFSGVQPVRGDPAVVARAVVVGWGLAGCFLQPGPFSFGQGARFVPG